MKNSPYSARTPLEISEATVAGRQQVTSLENDRPLKIEEVSFLLVPYTSSEQKSLWTFLHSHAGYLVSYVIIQNNA